MSARPHLVALPGLGQPQPHVMFCGHCGLLIEDRPDRPDRPGPASRVCADCNLGLLISAPRNVAPHANDPFLLVDGSLSICGVSRLAEGLFRVRESDVVDRPVTELLMPADAEIEGPESFVSLLLHAARGEGEVRDCVVRPTSEWGIRFWARVGPCGPPRAALLVLAEG
jgi:PAS domain-containing protein